MKRDWIALIAAPTANQHYKMGTGVPISQKHILTCAHTLKEAISNSLDIKIRFLKDSNEKNSWRQATVVWYDDSDSLDAALLEFEPDDRIEPFIHSSYVPEKTVDWQGAGFPAASILKKSETETIRLETGLTGKITLGGNTGEFLELGADYKPSKPELWAGISGAPVIVGDKLVAIIKTLPKNFDGGKLNALPIYRLLKINDFTKHFGIDERKAHLEAIKRKISSFLQDDRFRSALAALFDQPGTLSEAAFTDHLFSLLLHDFISKSYRAGLEFKEKSPQYIPDLHNLTKWLIPFLYDPVTIHALKPQVSNGVLIRMPSATPTLAEIIMAGIDQRKVDYYQSTEGADLRGTTDISAQPPETGFDFENKEFINNFDKLMFDKFLKEQDKNRKIEEKRQLVNAWLNHSAFIQKEFTCRYYFVSKVDDDEQAKQINELQKYYPELVFLSLSDNFNNLVQERKKIAWILNDFFNLNSGEVPA